ATEPLAAGSGAIARITLHVRDDAPTGPSVLHVEDGSQLNEGQLALTPMDGAVTVAAAGPAPMPSPAPPQPPATPPQPATGSHRPRRHKGPHGRPRHHAPRHRPQA